MRMYEIALFMLIFSVILSFVQVQGLFGNARFGVSEIPTENELINRLNQSQQGTSEYDPFGFQDATAFIGATIHGLQQVAYILYGATLGIGSTIGEVLGGSDAAHSVAAIIALPIWMVYLLALMQFIRGTGTKGMD